MESFAKKRVWECQFHPQILFGMETGRCFRASLRKGLAEYDEMESIAWFWQSIDGAMVKAPLALEPLEQIQRIGGKNGTKRSLLVDGNGIPLSLVIGGARRHNMKLLEPTLDAIVVDRPSEAEGPKQHLSGDKGYSGQPAHESMQERGYIPHVRQRGEETEKKKRNPRYRARR